MYTITVKTFVDAPLECVWASWDDFENIDRFHPFVAESRRLGDTTGPVGIGAKRECELTDGSNWIREQITEYQPMKTLAVDVYEHSLPVRSLSTTLRFRALGESRTEVTMTAVFAGRGGLLGRLLSPLTRRRFRPAVTELLKANAAYVERTACEWQTA